VSEQLFLQCGEGLEAALADELAELGYSGVSVPGGAEVEAPDGSHMHLNLHSRVASKVLLRVATVRTAGDLSKLNLDRYGAAFHLEATGLGAQPYRDAAAKHFKQASDGTWLLVRVDKRGLCMLSVDTTGELLHFRGYRQEVGRAPIRETLAAAVLRMADWNPAESLWDVMCGSGTFIIEGAERSLGLAAGRARHFAFEKFPSHDAAAFAKLKAEAGSTAAQPMPALIGTDLNAGALGTARRNAKRSGVLEHLKLERLDATALSARPGVTPGLLLANLPYGKRVGERSELATLYKRLGQSVRKGCPGWRFAFLLEEGAEHLDLPLAQVFPLGNGGLNCTLVTGRLDA
jgi:putative N6-adenine-specific DNA methylase